MGNQHLSAAFKQYRKEGLEEEGQGMLLTSEILLERAGSEELLEKFTSYFLRFMRVTDEESEEMGKEDQIAPSNIQKNGEGEDEFLLQTMRLAEA